jgi:hypothetical protein
MEASPLCFVTMGRVWETRLEGTLKLVALALADYTNTRDRRCDPGIDTIAFRCGLSERTVRRAIEELEKLGALTVNRTPGAGHSYIVTPDNLSTPTPDTVSTPPGQDVHPPRSSCPPYISKPRINLEENLFAPSTSGSTPADPPQPPRLNGAEAIPLVGGVEWHCPPALLTELDRLYPAVDPVQTFREIRAWCITNPGKRKTTRGVERFVNRWFAQEQDRHGRT